MTEAETLQAWEKAGALIRNSHIIYTSGRHGESYVNKDAVYPDTALTSKLCRAIAEHFAKARVEVCLAPALGGIILSQWVAHHLSEITRTQVLGVYAEKSEDGESFVIKRGYDKLIRGKRVLLLEDVMTTGISVKRVVTAARQAGAEIIAVAALCNRGGVTSEEIGGVPELFAQMQLSLMSWEARECPLCAKGVPVNTSVGKGKHLNPP